MNGIKLKEANSPLIIERIKWISLLLLSHGLIFLLSSDEVEIKEQTLPIRANHVRLQLPIENQIPEEDLPRKSLLITKKKRILSPKALLIKKIETPSLMDNQSGTFLVEIPEEDLGNFIDLKNHLILAFPASKKISISKKKQRKSYEIIF